MSRIRKKISYFMYRLRRSRRRRYLTYLYNSQRQVYYAGSSRKTVKSDLKVSIVVPCYNPPIAFFEELLSSILGQSYANWELVLADGSPDETIADHIKQKSEADIRIKYIKIDNRGIAVNTNVALEAATGDLIAFLDHDDTLDPDALAYSVEQFEKYPDLGMTYSDEDKLTNDGTKYLDPHFKPDFSLDMLRNVNYITHFVVARTKLVQEVGGIRTGYDGAQDFDFLLRIADTGARIHHIPRILYHWRLSPNSTAADFDNKQHVTNAGAKALNDHYARNNIEGVQASAIKHQPGFYIAKYQIKPAKRAVVICLGPAVNEVTKQFVIESFKLNKSLAEANVEILSAPLNDIELDRYDSVMIVTDLCIPGSAKSRVSQLFAVAEQPGVYAVSPKFVADGKIVDMGLVETAPYGQLSPLFSGMEKGEVNFFGALEWVRNVNALSGRVYVMSGKNAAKHLESGDRIVTGHTGRIIVWSHIEMVALANLDKASATDSKQKQFYNENLSFNYTPFHRGIIPINALMKEQETGVLVEDDEEDEDDE